MAETDAEIAALEAKLAALKETKQAEDEVADMPEAMLGEQEDGFDFSTLSSRKKVAVTQQAAPSELLSEAWKEDDTDQAGSPIISIVQADVGLLVAAGLFAFAQVPVGQSGLDSVTYGGKETRLESAAEIRARYESIGGVED